VKFANDYLKELLGVQVRKLEFNLSHNDQWYYPLCEEVQVLNGRICMSISFETNCVIVGTKYGSIRVIQFEEEPNGVTWSYKCLCLQGKETNEPISYLGGKGEY